MKSLLRGTNWDFKYISLRCVINPLTPEVYPPRNVACPYFLLGILIFKWLTAQRLYKSFGVKGLRG
jgi:hypothetical protein